MGPWLADTIRQCDGLVDEMSYWTFSDVFEEQGVVKQPFYGGYGLIAAGGIPKPAFSVFKMLHQLGKPAHRARFRFGSGYSRGGWFAGGGGVESHSCRSPGHSRGLPRRSSCASRIWAARGVLPFPESIGIMVTRIRLTKRWDRRCIPRWRS